MNYFLAFYSIYSNINPCVDYHKGLNRQYCNPRPVNDTQVNFSCRNKQRVVLRAD